MPVCIAGMHRSGTSMVARLLNLCGLYLGRNEDLLQGDFTNPEGHWENIKFLELNDRLLERFGGAWDVRPNWSPHWEQSATVADLREKAANLATQFQYTGIWGWKDPRNSLTLPFWQTVIPDLKVIVCLRHPAAVVQSLNQRGRSSVLFGLNLWRAYCEGILATTTPATRLVTHYDAYFQSAPDELSRVLEYTGLPISTLQVKLACQTVQGRLRHYQPDVSILAEIPQSLLDLYEQMTAEAGSIYAASLKQPAAPGEPEAVSAVIVTPLPRQAEPTQPLAGGTEPIVSVIVPNYNGREIIGDCLNSLLALDYPKDRLEVIVVDDASTDGSVELIEERFPQVVIVRQEANQGFARAANSGAAKAKGDYIAFLNSDMRVEPDWLTTLVEAVQSANDIASAGSLILKWDSDVIDFAGRNEDALDLANDAAYRLTPYRAGETGLVEILFASGGAMLMRKAEFEALGAFDPDFGMYHEDVDLGWHLWLKGRRVVLAPRSVVHHRGAATSGQLPRPYVEGLLVRNAILTLFKNLETGTLRDMLPIFIYYLLERHTTLSQYQTVVPSAIAELQALAPMLVTKRAMAQLDRQRSDIELAQRLGQPLSFLSKQHMYQLLGKEIEEQYPPVPFDPAQADSVRAALGRWLEIGQFINNQRLVRELRVAEQYLAAELAERDRVIAEQGQALVQQDKMLVERSQLITDQGGMMAEQDRLLVEKNHAIAELGHTMAEQNAMLVERNRVIVEQGETLAKQNQMLMERNQVITEQGRTMAEQEESLRKLVENAHAQTIQLDALRQQLNESDSALARQERIVAQHRDDLAQQAETIRQMSGSKFWMLRNGYYGLRVKVQQALNPVQKLRREFGKLIRKGQANGVEDFQGRLTLLPKLDEEAEQVILSRPANASAAEQRKLDIICFSIIDWSFRYQRPQQIMAQFASRGHRVFYIRPAEFLAANSSPSISVRERLPNLYEVSLTAHHAVDIYKEIVEAENLVSMSEALDELRETYGIREAVLYVMKVSWAPLAQQVRAQWGWPLLYDCMDDWDGFPGIKPALVEWEPKLVQSCDLLVVTGQLLYDKWKAQQPKIVLARNAVDYEYYQAHLQPNTLLAETPRPIIGYIGALADWFDFQLVAHAAQQRPNYTFALVGGSFVPESAQLEKLPNVKLLGQQPYETMPQYVYDFDVCMIPFKLNPITAATDPVKLYEYLAAGKPIVTTALPELAPYQDVVRIGHTPNEFVAQIDAALKDAAALKNDPAQGAARKAVAQRNTWAIRYQQITAGLKASVPPTSIIIVTYNNLALTKLCLESVFRNTQYLNYEVIVVDNNSSDGTPEYLQQLAGQVENLAVVLNSKNEGFAKANNQGLAQAVGAYLVLLNNDTIVSPGWLGRLLRPLADKTIGLVGPVTNFVGNEAKLDVPYKTWGEMEAFALKRAQQHAGQVAEIGVLAMYCVAMRRDLFTQVGYLDEQFGVGMFEDDDYAMRVRQWGYRVVCALDVFIHHVGQAAFRKLIETGTYSPLFAENKRRYETKWKTVWVPHQHATLTPSPVTPSIASKPKTAPSTPVAPY